MSRNGDRGSPGSGLPLTALAAQPLRASRCSHWPRTLWLALLLLAAIASVAHSGEGPVVIDSYVGGLYNNLGNQDRSIPCSYFPTLSGVRWQEFGPNQEFRSYFSFDLEALALEDPVVRGTLFVPVTNYLSANASEPVDLFDVVTPISQVDLDSTGRTDIFDDLGTGALYGMTEIFPSDAGGAIEVELSEDAIADINAAVGELFAIGLSLPDPNINVSGVNEAIQWTFCSEPPQLELHFVPEPGSQGLAAVCALMALRRTRRIDRRRD